MLHIQFKILFKTRARFIVGGTKQKIKHLHTGSITTGSKDQEKNHYAGFVGMEKMLFADIVRTHLYMG